MKLRKEQVIVSFKKAIDNRQKCNKLDQKTLDQMRRTQIIYGQLEKSSL